MCGTEIAYTAGQVRHADALLPGRRKRSRERGRARGCPLHFLPCPCNGLPCPSSRSLLFN
eukprot:1819743-Rhodomonas_salina.1